MNNEWDEFIYDNFIEIFEEIAMNELIDEVAKKIAVIYNSGDKEWNDILWSSQYSEQQRNILRETAKEIIEIVKHGLVK